MDGGAWKAAVHGVAEGQTRLRDFTFTFHFPALEKEMAGHSSVLAWRIPGTAEPGGLLSVGLHRVGRDWSDLACMHTLEKEMATRFSVLAWRTPGTGEPGGLPSVESHRVGHDWSDLAAAVHIYEYNIHIYIYSICSMLEDISIFTLFHFLKRIYCILKCIYLLVYCLLSSTRIYAS